MKLRTLAGPASFNIMSVAVLSLRVIIASKALRSENDAADIWRIVSGTAQ